MSKIRYISYLNSTPKSQFRELKDRVDLFVSRKKEDEGVEI